LLLKTLAKTIIQALTATLRVTAIKKERPVSPVITALIVPPTPALPRTVQTMPQLILPSVQSPVLLSLSPLTSIIQTILLPPPRALNLAAAPTLALTISTLLIPVMILVQVLRPVTVLQVTLIAPMSAKQCARVEHATRLSILI